MEKSRPVTIAVHPKLEHELKERRRELDGVTIEGDKIVMIGERTTYPHQKEVNVTLVDTQAFENTMMISELKEYIGLLEQRIVALEVGAPKL